MSKPLKIKSEDAHASQGCPRNFTTEEDIFLAPSYNKIATDAKMGNHQPLSVFWGRIKDSFEFFCKESMEVTQLGLQRTGQALKNRFDRHFPRISWSC